MSDETTPIEAYANSKPADPARLRVGDKVTVYLADGTAVESVVTSRDYMSPWSSRRSCPGTPSPPDATPRTPIPHLAGWGFFRAPGERRNPSVELERPPHLL